MAVSFLPKKIDLHIPVFVWCNRQADGSFSSDLFRIVIAHRISVRNGTKTVACAGLEQKGFYKRSLAGAAVSGDCNVFDLV